MQNRIQQLMSDVDIIDDHRARVGGYLLLADTSLGSTSTRRSQPPIFEALTNTLYVKYYCAVPESEKASIEEYTPSDGRLAHSNQPLVEQSSAKSYRAENAEENINNAEQSPSLELDSAFLQELRAANARAETWLPDWIAHGQTSDGRCVVFCGELVATTSISDLRESQDANGQPTGSMQLRMKTEDISYGTGFYFAYGVTPADALTQNCVIRIYFNLSPAGAAAWVRMVSETLDRYQIPFTLKCLLHPAHFRRSDSAVLYVARSQLRTVWQVLLPKLAQLSDYLRTSVPMFAWPAAAGIGMADDPGNGESFGQHRVRLIAQALYALVEGKDKSGPPVAGPRKADDLSTKWSALQREFQTQGLDLAAPHVHSGHIDFASTLSNLATS